MPTIDTQSLPQAGLTKRLAAMLYDSLLLLAISIGYGALALGFKVKVLGIALAEGEKANLGVIGFIGWILVVFAFYCLFWHRFGQTLGMKAWRLQVTDTNGELLTYRHGLIRCICACLSLALLGLGYVWAWVDKEKLTLHDRLSHTRVWQLPKEKR